MVRYPEDVVLQQMTKRFFFPVPSTLDHRDPKGGTWGVARANPQGNRKKFLSMLSAKQLDMISVIGAHRTLRWSPDRISARSSSVSG